MSNPKIVYEDTTHKTLGLGVSFKDIDVTDLSIISKKKFKNVEIGILGASHYVKVSDGDKTFSEVFACRKLDGMCNYTSLEELKSGTKFIDNELVDYHFTMEVISDSRSINNEMDIANTLSGDDDYEMITLKELFPTEEKPIFEACTHVQAFFDREQEGDIHIFTIHAYPEENIIVKTESKIKLN